MSAVRGCVRFRFLTLFAVSFFAACSSDKKDPTGPDPVQVTIQLTAPVGGESLQGTLTIQWQSQNATTETVTIRLSDDSGASYGEVLVSGQPHSGSWVWDVSERSEGSSYRIKVEVIGASQNVVASAACGSDFSIDLPGVVDLLAPVGGETWSGSETISWQSQYASNETATILLSTNSGATFEEIVSSGLSHTGTYDWDASDRADGSTYRVRVDLLDASQAVVSSDESDTDFTIEQRLRLADINFPDANMRDRVLATGKTYADEVTDLSGYQGGINDITGIEYLTNLTTLRLDTNSIVDISALAGLVKLTDLDIGRNQIADFSPLAALTGLTILELDTNPAEDLGPLAGLTSLTRLRASYIKPNSWIPIGSLTGLEELLLQGCDLTDIDDFAVLVNLKYFAVPNNDLTSLAPVAGMTGLEELSAFSNGIMSTVPLAGLTSLKVLRLGGNPLTDFTGLPSLVNLEVLSISGNGFTDLGQLSGMTKLDQLWVTHGGVVDLSPVTQFPAIRSLYLQDNPIVDLSPLVGLQNIEDLDLFECSVTDVSSLASLTTLEYLRVKDNAVTAGVASLVTLTNARTIDLEGNPLIPCGDLDTLEAALGSGVVKRPNTCS